MATSHIRVEGFVAKDPEQRAAGNHTITTVTVPITQGRRKDGQFIPDTDDAGNEITHWYEGEFWNEYGQQVGQEIRKGYLVELEGEPRSRAYVKKDGTAGIQNSIVNARVKIIVRRPKREQGGGYQQPQGQGVWGHPNVAGPNPWDQSPSQGQPAGGNFGGGFDDDSQPF